MERKRIVILGGGFGGLTTAFSISKELHSLRLLDSYELVLIDRNEHHTFIPLLYEVATTAKETANLIHLHDLVTHNLTELTTHSSIRFIQDEVQRISPKEGLITLKKNGTMKAEYIVLALGSEVNYFNIPGLKEYSLTLKSFFDAIHLRDAIVNLAENKSVIEIVVGGAGPTGVELAGELTNWCSRSLGCQLHVTLIEAQPNILFGFPSNIAGRAERRLRDLGVHIKTQAKILQLSTKEVELGNGEKIPFDLFVWSGGVKTPDLLLNLPLKTETRGRIETHETMACLPQTPDLELGCMVYGIGDNVCSYDPRTNKPVPAVAPAAIAQAGVAAHNIMQDIRKAEGLPQTIRRTYIPADYPYVIPVGGKYVIAKIGPIVLAGIFGWIFKGLVEFYYLTSIMPKSKAFRVWIKGLLVFMKNDKLG